MVDHYGSDFYRKVIDNMLTAYCFNKAIYDKEGHLVSFITLEVNENFEKIVGKSEEEIIGRDIYDVFPNTEKQWVDKFDEVVRNGNQIILEEYHKDTKKYYKLHAWRPKKDHFISTFVDITEKRNQLTQLRKSSERYKSLVESHNSLVVRMDMEGKLTLVNRSYCDKFGKKKEDILGTKFVPQIHDDDIEETRSIMRKMFSPPYRSTMIQRTWTPNGWCWISWEDCLIFGEDGTPSEIQAVGYDVTELKENEIKLARSNEDLESFAYVASHDLQEPLRKIIAFEDLLREDINKNSNKITNEGSLYLSKISSAALRMKNLIDDLLEYSRITRRCDPFEYRDLSEIIYDIFRNELEKDLIEIKPDISLDIKIPYVRCDPIQIRRVFQNLISNSIKYRKKNEKLKIGIYSSKSEDRREFDVIIEDNGVGFENEYSDAIFGSFYKLHSRNEYEGTGMGLSICKRIIERHDWTIKAESEINKGCKITISIPTTYTK